jgi:hypothetical protein
MVYATSDYNTGYMVGDIKLATLSDTDATDVTGSELVTNGTFDTDVSGWTLSEGDGTIAYSSGTAVVTYGTYPTSFQQTFAIVIGKTYTIETTLIGGTSSIRQFYYNDSTDANISVGGNPGVSQSVTFTAQTTTLKVWMRVAAAGTGIYDNISVRLAEEDRSVNNNGLQVFGTVTKDPVATGADLVAYSGFSASNYLQQPYNSDLDFGTGDFSVMGWVKTTTTNHHILLHRAPASSTGYFLLQLRTDGKLNVFLTSTNTFTVKLTSNATLNSGTWTFFTVRRSSGVLSIEINGVADSSVSDSTTLTIPNGITSVSDSTTLTIPNGITNIGSRIDNDESFTNGSLALFRISATAPTAEQIAKIYRDEKPLFQENAQATLYGTSDGVTALAYDDGTELLHAGTSAGRSVFQGLQRVSNTTDAIGVAISASNDLVVEE